MGKLRIAAPAVVVGAALTATVALAANPAGLDTSFSGDGTRKLGFGFSPRNDEARDVTVTGGGKVVAAGSATQSQGNSSFGVARLLENGKPDGAFSHNGRRAIDFGTHFDEAKAAAIQGDGKVVVVGVTQTVESQNDVYQAAIARLTADGRLDKTFAGDGKRITGFGGNDDEFFDVAVLPNGKIVAVGLSIQGSINKMAVARYLPNGSLDHSFSGDGERKFTFPGRADSEAAALAVDRRGRLVVAGQAAPGGTNEYDFAVARLLSGGALDSSFSNDGRRAISFAATDSNGANGVAIDGAGRIVLGGYLFLARSYFAVARLGPGGGLDTTFSKDGRRIDGIGMTESFARDITVQANGKILAAGFADPTGTGDEDFALIRYRTDGTHDPGFSGDGIRYTRVEIQSNARAEGIALDRDGRIVMAGRIDDDGGNTSFAFARLRGGP